MHRAEQIVDAMVALQPTAGARFKNRTLALSELDGELPASVVKISEDAPLDEIGASNFAFLDSLLTLNCELLVRADTEDQAISALMDLRTLQHIAIMADRTLGLSAFVIDTRYAGSEAPEIDAVQEYTAARLVTRWHVHYRMNIGDPS
jgi:hypothetical protein